MKQTGKCPKCGSEDIIADAKAIDRSHAGVQEEMAVATFRRPEALLFKEQQISNVSASERSPRSWRRLGASIRPDYLSLR